LLLIRIRFRIVVVAAAAAATKETVQKEMTRTLIGTATATTATVAQWILYNVSTRTLDGSYGLIGIPIFDGTAITTTSQ
jgi:hypothetical protein